MTPRSDRGAAGGAARVAGAGRRAGSRSAAPFRSSATAKRSRPFAPAARDATGASRAARRWRSRSSLDGKYSQHLQLVRGEATADYPIALGRVGKGQHRLTIDRDPALSAAGAGRGDDRRAGHRRLHPVARARDYTRAVDGADRLRPPEHRRQVHRSAAADVVRDRADAARPSVPLLGDLLQRGRRHPDRSPDGDVGTDDRHRVHLRRRRSTSAGGSSREEFQGARARSAGVQGPARRRGIRCCGCRPTTTWSANAGPTAIRYAPVPAEIRSHQSRRARR